MDDRSDPAPRLRPQTMTLRALQLAVEEAELALARRMRMAPTDLSALEHLSLAPGTIGPGELSGRLGLTPAAGTELVNRLERAGHVTRTRDDVDRRRVHLHVTPTATAQVLVALRELFAALDAVADARTPEQRSIIDGYFADVIAAYREFGASQAESTDR